jgi:hypothetical protein
MTDFSNICDILGEISSQYKEDDEFKDFIAFNDLGIPLAYLTREALVTPSKVGERYILETWDIFLQGLGLEDKGFTDLNSVLDQRTSPASWNVTNLPSGNNQNEDATRSEGVPGIAFRDLTYAGSFAVDSGQAMVGDPCYLDEWEPWANGTPFDHEGHKGKYGYLGASGVTLDDSYGDVGGGKGVVFSTGYGDGYYPVFVKIIEDGRVGMVVIDFEGGLDPDDYE